MQYFLYLILPCRCLEEVASKSVNRAFLEWHKSWLQGNLVFVKIPGISVYLKKYDVPDCDLPYTLPDGTV